MSLFTAVEMAPRDPILGLNEQFNADTNPHKVNLGVGVYYDDNGTLPLLQCVREAEKQMMEAPKARGYLPIFRPPVPPRACTVATRPDLTGSLSAPNTRFLTAESYAAMPSIGR